VTDFRKDLPVKFLAGKVKENARRRGEERAGRKRAEAEEAAKRRRAAEKAGKGTPSSLAASLSSPSLLSTSSPAAAAAGGNNNRSNDDGDDVSLAFSEESVLTDMDPADVEIMRVAVGKVVDGMTRLILGYYSQGFARIVEMRDASRNRERLSKALQIQKWYRSLWVKRMVKRRRDALRGVAEDEVKLVHVNRFKRRALASLIQSHIRGFLDRRRVLSKIALIEAAKTIQRAWERKKVRSTGMNEVANYWFRQGIATVIQSAVRSYRSRVVVAYLRRNDRHRKLNAHYGTDGGVVRLNFEMNGAAARIQRWFKALPYRVRKLALRLRRNKAKQIQRWYLRKKMKNSTLGKLLDFRFIIQARERAAVLINPVVRGGVVRLRVRRLDRLRKEAEVARKEAEVAEREIAHKLSQGANAKALKQKENNGYFSRFKNAVHLEELNPMTILKHRHAAVVIQKHMRRCLAKSTFAQMAFQQKVDAATVMQKKFKVYSFRKSRWAAINILLRIWLKVKRRRASKARMITKIQAIYRMRLARRKARAFSLLWVPTAVTIQKVVRGYLHRCGLERVSQNLYWDTEFKMNGALEYQNTHLKEVQRQLYHHSVHFKSPHHPAELQCIFGHYCSMGQRGDTERLGGNMFLKLCKESNLLTKSLNQQKVELLFAHEKGKDTHLHYPQFLSAMHAVAEIKHADVQTYGSYKDAAARLLKMIQEDIISPKSAREFVKDLKDEKAEHRATRRAEESCGFVQKNWRAAKHNQKMKGMFLNCNQLMIDLRKLRALFIMQRGWRCALSRRSVRLAALKVYQKIVDEHHGGQVYYFNSHTGNASWKKPVFFGKFDIDNPVKMPSNDRLYKKTCDFCGKVTATWYDIIAEENFCKPCNETVHAKGKRAENKCVTIDNCVQCEFQVATKFCVQCRDMYCDTCYFDQHKKGMLQKHYYDVLMAHCATCKTFVALLSVNEAGKSEPTPMCKPCYKQKWSWDTAFTQNNARVQATPYVHEPPAVAEHWRGVEEEKRKKKLEEEFRISKAEDDVIVRAQGALRMQRMWRGSKGRKKGVIVMARRKMERIQRARDESSRQAMWYIMRLWIGAAPELLSDTISEKVLKRFPSRWSQLVTDVVDNEWEEAYSMISDQENFEKKGREEGVTRWEKVKKVEENMTILMHVLHVANTRRSVNKQKRAMEKAQLKYRNARSDVSASSADKERFKMEMRRTKNVHKRGEKLLAQDLETLGLERDVMEERKGPNLLKKKIAEVRREGLSLRWKKKDIVWHLKRFENVVKPISGDVDVFGGKKPLLRIGSRLRLGEKERHGLLFYTVIDPIKKLTFADKIRDRVTATLDKTGQKATLEQRRLDKEAWNSKHLRLDRQWMLDLTDGGGGPEGTIAEEGESASYVHLMPRELLGPRVTNAAKEWGRNNALSQFAIAMAFKACGGIANNCEDLSKKFDEDSSTARDLKIRAVKYREKQKEWLLLSNTLMVETEEGESSGAMGRVSDSAKMMLLVAKKEFLNVLGSLKRKKKVEIDQFGKWDSSEEKVGVVIEWSGVEKNIKMGVIMMDLDAPASVGREYCRRSLREALNAQCGENFKFVAKGEGLPLEEESSKRITHLAPQKFNPESREIEHTLAITENKDENLPRPNLIPLIKSEAEKASERLFEAKKLAALALDERKKDIEMEEEYKAELLKALLLAGIKEKKAAGAFNRKGLLNPAAFNDMTRNIPTDVREKLKRIVDKAMGVDTLAFLARGAMSEEEFIKLQKKEAEEMQDNLDSEIDEMLETEERVLVQEKRAKKKIEAREQEEEEEAKKKAKQDIIAAKMKITMDEIAEDSSTAREGQGGGGGKGDGKAAAEEKKIDVDDWEGGGGEAQQGAAGPAAAGDNDASAKGEEYYTPWVEAYDEENNVYYYNNESGVSQYEYPDEWGGQAALEGQY